MTGIPLAATLLAAALVTYPSSPGRRLPPPRPRRIMPPAATACIAVCLAGALSLLLPVTTMIAAGTVAGTVGLRLRRDRLRRRAFDEGRTLESALDVLVGELGVGSHPVRAFSVAADETCGAVAVSLRAVAARAGLGADVTTGLRDAACSSALPAHWGRLAVCWQLAAEHGLAIATLMRAAKSDIAERQRYSARVAASLSGARATATILAALPVLGVLLGQLIGARPLGFLLGGQVGGWLLVVGSALACAGLLWSDRITDRVTNLAS